MIDIKEKYMCDGCHACYSVCPKDAINMEIDDEGFWYPKVDNNKCVDCNKCEKVCPILNKKEVKSLKKAYACYNLDEDIRMKSSSGGTFTILAAEVIKDNGVVFGAKFDEDFNVVHDYVEDIEGLSKFRGSKYVQSNIGDSFRQAKKFLDEGRRVLFSGTPCQIDGLKSYLNKDYENLVTVDLICHGVPSPMIWQRYINELGDGKKLSAMTFRDKSKGWNSGVLKYRFEDGSEIDENYSESVYIKGFIQNCFLRPSCYNCNFKTLDRVSDFTLGDFWGVESILPKLKDNKGISLVFVHSEKSDRMMKEIKKNIYLCEVEIENSITWNSCAIKSLELLPNRNKFFRYVDEISVKEAVDKSLYKSKLKRISERQLNLIKRIKRKLASIVFKYYYDLKDFTIKKCFRLNMKDMDESIDYLVNNHVSLARFGDGEFGIINSKKIGFQETNKDLSDRLKEVLTTDYEGIMICIPGMFLNTDDMVDRAKQYWDNYLKQNRMAWYRNLNRKKTYYNAHLTRLYMDYKDKSKVGERFKKLKSIWKDRDIVIVEGEFSKLGVGNDLFKNTNSISRIICPSKNAFNKYDEILETVKKVDNDKLILIALGPTATVLAYDLHLLGYQALDIGHIDIEYEWFLRKAIEKVAIENKYVNEVLEGRITESQDNDEEYLKEILFEIKD